jgi:hypothetical protein
MWQLKEEKGNIRIYINSLTGSKSEQEMVYQDKEGNKWYHFRDLTALPHVRKFAAMKISSLYTLGLSKDDLNGFITSMKTILKSEDSEKYEKAYGTLLDFQVKAENATDAIKQMSSLTCIYFTINDEDIDSFDQQLQANKMAKLEASPEMHSFFLGRQMQMNEDYNNSLKIISQIASHSSNGL